MATNAELAARTRYRMKKQDARDAAGRAMLAALKAAAEAHGPLGDDTRPAWWPTACAAIAQAEAAGIKAAAADPFTTGQARNGVAP